MGRIVKREQCVRSALFWACIPWVLPQALALRRRAPRFAPATGPGAGSVGDGEPRRLLALGDSIIAGVGAATLTTALVGQTALHLSRRLGRRIEWSAHAHSGASCEDMLRGLVPALAVRDADFVLLSVGVNDVTTLSGLRRWRRNLDALLAAMRTNSPRAIIAVAGLPPLGSFPLLPQPLRAVLGLRGRQFDSVAREEAARHASVVHVPLPSISAPEQFCADGFHPSESSYSALGHLMADALATSANADFP